MKRLLISAAGAVLSIALIAPPVFAQQTCNTGVGGSTCVTTVSVAMTTGAVVDLTQSSATTSLGAPTAADFNAGYKASSGPSFAIKANSDWTLQVRAGSSTWAATNTSPGVSARSNKPASDLQWSTSADGVFAGLTLAGVTIASGSATAAASAGIFYRTQYAWLLDTPGSYSLDVIVTLSAP